MTLILICFSQLLNIKLTNYLHSGMSDNKILFWGSGNKVPFNLRHFLSMSSFSPSCILVINCQDYVDENKKVCRSDLILAWRLAVWQNMWEATGKRQGFSAFLRVFLFFCLLLLFFERNQENNKFSKARSEIFCKCWRLFA